MITERKTVVLGVTGSIAAYKAADLASRMVKEGLDVHVVMTAAATRLVGERTFLTLSRNPVVTSLWELPDWSPGHVALADMACLLVIAPCTANTMAKLAHGIADDALSTYAVSHAGLVLVAPAMNSKMWCHPATRANADTLRGRGVRFVGPDCGPLACGTDGEGRMSQLDAIMAVVLELTK